MNVVFSLDFIHGIDCSLSFILGLEADESEATTAASVTVLNDNLGHH